MCGFFFVKQKTAYEMRISDWSSDGCSSRLNDAYVILDEAQNTTIGQMKMCLTRLGFGSTAVVTGDLTQIDLPKHVKSGLRDAVEVLHDVEGVSFTFFESRDVVRHPLVARIVNAYEHRDAQDASTGPA